MQIQSKNNGLVHEVSRGEWERMKSRNDHRHYKVVDDSDSTIISEKIRVEEIGLVDTYDDLAEFTDLPPTEEDEAEFIREKLKVAGVYFHPKTGVVKLRKLYEQI